MTQCEYNCEIATSQPGALRLDLPLVTPFVNDSLFGQDVITSNVCPFWTSKTDEFIDGSLGALGIHGPRM